MVKNFEIVALPHLESVARFACSLTRSQADADDLVQETFLGAFRGWHTFAAGPDCRRWLFTICRNTFANFGMRGRLNLVPLDGAPDPTPDAIGVVHALVFHAHDLGIAASGPVASARPVEGRPTRPPRRTRALRPCPELAR